MMQMPLILLLTLLLQSCCGLPMFLVQSGRGKCLVVTAAEGTLLHINYEAPDLVVGNDTATSKFKGPTWLNVRSREKQKHSSERAILTEQLSQKEGHVTYRVPVDGDVDICIRASTASSKAPLRFGLSVHPIVNVPRLLDVDPQDMNHHWTFMEDEIRHLLGQMTILQREADFAKNQEATFHSKTREMHAASMWWPILHVAVLLVTGFTQATHIVRFFQSRHIV